MNCHCFYYVCHQRIIIDTGDHVGHTDKAIYNWKGMRNQAKKLNFLPFSLYENFKCKVKHLYLDS